MQFAGGAGGRGQGEGGTTNSSMEEVVGLERMRDQLGAERGAQGRGGVWSQDNERRSDVEKRMC